MQENENCFRSRYVIELATKCDMNFGFWFEQTNYKNTFMENKKINTHCILDNIKLLIVQV